MGKSFNGNYITEYREKNHLTQAKFVTKFNAYLKEHGIEGDYSNKSISMWENGNREPQNLDIIKLLADFIGVSVDTICNGVHIETTKSFREYPDVNDIVSSWEINEFVFGDIERKDRETIVSSFWQFVPIYFDFKNDNNPGYFELWAHSAEDITNALEDACEIEKFYFKQYLCAFALDSASDIESGYVLSEYLFDRFSIEHLVDMYDCFLGCDLEEYTKKHEIDKIEFNSECVEEKYTSEGLLLRIETTAKISQEIFDTMYREYCEQNGLEIASALANKNKKTASFWMQ